MRDKYIIRRANPSSPKEAKKQTEEKQTSRPFFELDNEVSNLYQPYKEANLVVSNSLAAIGREGRSERCSNCGTLLAFAWPKDRNPGEGRARLVKANFCRDRMCPHCARRRSLKLFGQMSKVLRFLSGRCRYLFLTLTVPNCSAEELPGVISKMMAGWNRLVGYSRFKGSVVGFFRALEVTYNSDPTSPSFGTYHPHFHIILAVLPSYFSGPLYIKHREWLELWRRAMRDDTISQVHIQAFRQTPEPGGDPNALVDYGHAICEATKYAVKPSDLALSLDVFQTLLVALSGRKITHWGGVLLEAKKVVCPDDVESPNSNLADTEDAPRPSGKCYVTVYSWNGYLYRRRPTRLADLDDPSEPVSPLSYCSPKPDPEAVAALAVLDREEFRRKFSVRLSQRRQKKGPGFVPGPER